MFFRFLVMASRINGCLVCHCFSHSQLILKMANICPLSRVNPLGQEDDALSYRRAVQDHSNDSLAANPLGQAFWLIGVE